MSAPRGASNGIWCQSRDVDLVRLLAGVGFDWLVLDAQHGGLDRAALLEVGRALRAAGAPFGVRVAAPDFTEIGIALDAGASILIAPQVDTAEQAAAVVRACYYPPIGGRSRGEFASLWGGQPRTVDEANETITCAVMIESAQALGNVAEIAAVPGVDMLFVGPHDLSLSLGIDVTQVAADGGPLALVRTTATEHGLVFGAFAGDVDRAQEFRAAGVEFLAVATEVAVVQRGAAAVLGALT